MTDHKKAGVAFWGTVVVVVALVGYPLSFGPACFLVSRRVIPVRPAAACYAPVNPVLLALFKSGTICRLAAFDDERTEAIMEHLLAINAN